MPPNTVHGRVAIGTWLGTWVNFGMSDRTAFIVGATGLVGGFLTNMLLSHADFGGVTTWVRQPTALSHPLLTEIVVDYDRSETWTGPKAATHFFCCLGTTRRLAGSAEAFRRVDLDYVLIAGEYARMAGARCCIALSSAGADANSKNLYLQTKGEMEAGLASQGFDSLHILRPGLLIGPRAEFRLGERIGAPILAAAGPLLRGGLAKYRSIAAEVVAAGMVGAAMVDVPGHHIHHNPSIQGLVGEF